MHFYFCSCKKVYKYLSKKIIILYILYLVQLVRFQKKYSIACIALVHFVRFWQKVYSPSHPLQGEKER